MSTYALTLESLNEPFFFKGNLDNNDMARFIRNRPHSNITFRADHPPVSIDSNWTLSKVHSDLPLPQILKAAKKSALRMTLIASGTVAPKGE